MARHNALLIAALALAFSQTHAQTINQLPAGAAVSGPDRVAAYQSSTVKVTATQLKTFMSASPALTGTPTTPTAASGNSSTQIASTAFVANGAGAFTVTANCQNAAGGGAIIQAAVNTGKTVHIVGPNCVWDSVVTVTTPGQIIYGDGRIQTTATVSGFLSPGALVLNTGYEGPDLRDFAMRYTQPDTAVRASLTNYPPLIYEQNQTRTKMTRMRLTGCITCIDARGNAGGLTIDDMEINGFGTTSTGAGIILIDGAQDTMRLSKVHIYPFELTTNQQTIFYDPGTIGISVGRVDGLFIDEMLGLAGTDMSVFYGTGGPGGTSWGTGNAIINVATSGFDTYNGIVTAGNGAGTDTGPDITIADSYFSMLAGHTAISMAAGHLSMAAINVIGQSSSAVPLFYFADTSGTNSVTWNGGNVSIMSGDNTVIAEAGGGTSVIQLNDLNFEKTGNIAYTRPVINVGNGTRTLITNSFINDKGTGAGTFISITADNYDYVVGNVAPGWTLTFPTPTNGVYSPNPH